MINIKIIRMIALSILLASLVVGCSSDDDPPTAVAGDPGGSKPPEPSPPSPEPSPPSPSPVDSSRIQGQWLSQCYGNTTGGGIKLGLAFKGKAFGIAFSEYPDDSCSQKPKQDVFKGTFVFGKAVTTPSGLSANELDLQIEGENGGTLKTLVGFNSNTMTINLGKGKRPDDITDSETTFELEKTSSSGGGGGSSGKECDSCKSKSDCGSGMTCAKFESGLSRCVTPDTTSCPAGG